MLKKLAGTTTLLPIFLVLLLLLSAAIGLAQEGGGYDLGWWTVDGGGTALEGGGISLLGTAGQPDAGPALSGGGYTLSGGFWPGAGAVEYRIYLPLVIRG